MDQDRTEQKEQQKERVEHINIRVEGQDRGRLGQIWDMKKNEGWTSWIEKQTLREEQLEIGK